MESCGLNEEEKHDSCTEDPVPSIEDGIEAKKLMVDSGGRSLLG